MSDKIRERVITAVRVGCLVAMAAIVLLAFWAMDENNFGLAIWCAISSGLVLAFHFFTFKLERGGK